MAFRRRLVIVDLNRKKGFVRGWVADKSKALIAATSSRTNSPGRSWLTTLPTEENDWDDELDVSG